MKRYILFTAILLLSLSVQAQQPHPADTIPVKILTTADSLHDGGIKFKAEARPLRPIAGAPEPFYSYFWEFGDGKFSFEKQPIHRYSDSGIYQVRVYATNNYDDGKPPPIRPRPVKTNGRHGMLAQAAPSIFGTNENLALRVNAMPKPSEEMVLIVAYRNKQEWGTDNLSGRLALYFNEKDFRKDNFKLEEIRSYHNEKTLEDLGSLQYAVSEILVEDNKHRGGNSEIRSIPVESAASEIKQRQELYRNSEYWSFENMKRGEERFMFLSLVTTPEMIQDTNAVITISAVFIPDDPSLQTEISDLELQIVASHDPNKMMLRRRLMNYRFTGKNRKLNYKVRFQNTGEGPAKQIKITVKTSEVVDPTKLVVTEMSPVCVPCKDAYKGQSCLDTLIFKDSIQFVFKNIYLPGIKQDGVNDADSTKGFIAYQLGFSHKPPKVPFSSSAAIVFDKNEPIKTNRAVGRFKPGLSPGIIAMYGLQMNKAPTVKIGDRDFNLGFSLSPYASFRKYLQAEIYLSGFNAYRSDVKRTFGGEITIDGERFKTEYQDNYTTSKVFNINIVPAQLRYNINRFIGLGFGPMVGIDLQSTQENHTEALVLLSQQDSKMIKQVVKQKSSFDNFRTSVFADVQIGLVRAGPAAGVRFFQSLIDKDQRLAFYLTWKL